MDLYSVIVPEDTKSSSVELLKKILKDDITVEGLMDLIGIEKKKCYPKENYIIDEFPEVVTFADYFEEMKNRAPYFRKNEGGCCK